MGAYPKEDKSRKGTGVHASEGLVSEPKSLAGKEITKDGQDHSLHWVEWLSLEKRGYTCIIIQTNVYYALCTKPCAKSWRNR